MPQITRRNVVKGLLAPTLLASRQMSETADAAISPGLREAAKAHGIFYGCAVKSSVLKDDADFVTAVSVEAGMLVPEYELKRGTVEAKRGAYDFSGSDRLLDFAQTHGMMMRGHTFVWHAANPAWLTESLKNKPDERILTDYITTVARRYKGKFHSWDVVNEAIEPKQGDARGLRVDSPWYQAFGESYIATAFHAARQADPQALLFYNDYNVEMANWHDSARRTAVLRLLEKLLSAGVPVDGFGVQAHLKCYGTRFDRSVFADFLNQIATMGLKIMVTELDIADIGGPADVKQRDREVSELGRRFLDVALANPAIAGVLTWGLSDKYSWLSEYPDYKWPDGSLSRGLPLDSSFQRKDLWHALQSGFLGKQ